MCCSLKYVQSNAIIYRNIWIKMHVMLSRSEFLRSIDEKSGAIRTDWYILSLSLSTPNYLTRCYCTNDRTASTTLFGYYYYSGIPFNMCDDSYYGSQIFIIPDYVTHNGDTLAADVRLVFGSFSFCARQTPIRTRKSRQGFAAKYFHIIYASR